ncbi:PIN domain-containing protein [Mariniphaga sp.]|uniref:PIN domain-containing protein n=1 Tax=Mariniphaga sp. TaxID=1954475 RepID=UPI003562FFCD
MSDKFFLDTNIFVYSFESPEQEKRIISEKLIKKAIGGNGSISFQVIQEFLNVATRKFAIPLKPEDSKLYIQKVLYPIIEVFPSKELYFSGLEIQQRWKYSFYDSLILAAALEAKCNILYSEDLHHNQKVEGLTIINPYL